MQLQTSRGVARLIDVVPEWRELLHRSAQDQPTLTPEWVLPWLEVFAPRDGRRVYVVELRDGGRLVGLAPLVARQRRHRRVLPLRRVELACCGERREDEILSEYVGVLAEQGREAEVARALADALDHGDFGASDEFGIPAMHGDDPMAEALVAALRATGWQAALRTAGDCPVAVLPGTWEGYLAALSPRRRQTVRRLERDLAAWAEGTLAVRVADDASGLARGREILRRLHGERWRVAGRDAGAFESNAFADFHDRAMPRLLEQGILELLWLEAHGEPVAVLYNLVWGNKVYHYQAGRRMDLPGNLRPGLAVHAAAIRRSIELGRSEYDFLSGAVRYKLEFSTTSRKLVDLEAVRPGLRHVARRAVDGLATAVRWRPSAKGAPPTATPADPASPAA